MNLLSLYYFVELAKELHVTNTAQKLYISQQNLSQHIQRLEQYYGVPLFHRKPKLALTYAGEQLYAVAVRILAEEHEFQNRLADISEKSIGNLKLGIPAYRGQILPRFYEKWPNIKIELCNESSSKMEERLYDGELDIFIGIMYQDNPKLESYPLLTDHIYLVCSDELLQKYYPDSWQSLKEESAGTVFKNPVSAPGPVHETPQNVGSMFSRCKSKTEHFPGIPDHGAFCIPLSL